MATARYVALTPIRHNGKLFAVGDALALTDAQAASLGSAIAPQAGALPAMPPDPPVPVTASPSGPWMGMSAGGVPAGMRMGPAVTKSDSYDIILHGGDTPAIIGGCKAARAGKNALVIIPRRLGGMVTGGLARTDMKGINPYVTLNADTREFYARIATKYGKTIHELAWSGASPLAHEPRVALQVLREMIAESGVTVLFGWRVKAVKKGGARAAWIELEPADGSVGSKIVRARELIDASITGDLAYRAGVTFTYGRTANSKYSETYGGVRGAQNILGGVSPYVVAGDAGSGLLPQVDPAALEALGTGDNRIQAPGYRLVVTSDPANMLPWWDPVNYDPAEFEMARRVIAASPTSYNSVAKLFTAAQIPSAPTKWDWNNRGALSTDVIDPRIGFTMDYATRDSYEAFIKRRTKNWLYFLRTDAAVPAELKAELAGYGPCRDEFNDDNTEGFPGECYWRDGFRMTKRNAKEVLREQHVLKTEVAANPICFATYPSDGHYRSYRNIAGVLNVEGGMSVDTNGYYGIHPEVMLPDAGQCDNLLVANSYIFAQSSVAQQSSRMEVTAINTVCAAVTWAMLAIDANTSLREVKAADLSPLCLPAIINPARVLSVSAPTTNGSIVTSDDGTGNTNIVKNINAASANGVPDYYGSSYWDDGGGGKGGRWVRYHPAVAADAYYRLRLNLPISPQSQPIVKITIKHADSAAAENFYVDLAKGGWFWRDIGTFRFDTSGNCYVRIMNEGDGTAGATTGKLPWDALAWDPVS